VARVLETFEAGGARLEYLPPYAPVFNPIANLRNKVKQALKSRDPRIACQLFRAVGAVFDTIAPKTAPASFYMPNTPHDSWR
jgi:hypothetical protein